MANPPWAAALKQTLTTLKIVKPSPRIAVIGVGHELRGDDAVGLAVARLLAVNTCPQPNVLICEGGAAPENLTGVLRQFQPDLVVFVDAAQMDSPPACVRWLTLGDLAGVSASTHTLPLSMVARYLETALGCYAAVIGIQPAQSNFGQRLSPCIVVALDEIVHVLIDALGLRARV